MTKIDVNKGYCEVMKTTCKKINRYPSHDKSLLHLAITPWLDERYKKVLAEGNAKRIAKYKGIDPLKFLIEQPFAIFRKKGYFHSTVVARDNGLLFPDPKIQLRTFEEFLLKTDPDKKIFKNSNIPEVIDKKAIELMVNSTESFPETPNYYITKLKETGNYVLLVFGDSLTLNLPEILETIFKGYDFQEIKGESLDEGDENYPQGNQSDATGYIIGSIKVKEVLLLEEEVTIDILNMKAIKKLLEFHEYYYNGKYFYNNKLTYGSMRTQ